MKGIQKGALPHHLLPRRPPCCRRLTMLSLLVMLRPLPFLLLHHQPGKCILDQLDIVCSQCNGCLAMWVMLARPQSNKCHTHICVVYGLPARSQANFTGLVNNACKIFQVAKTHNRLALPMSCLLMAAMANIAYVDVAEGS